MQIAPFSCKKFSNEKVFQIQFHLQLAKAAKMLKVKDEI